MAQPPMRPGGVMEKPVNGAAAYAHAPGAHGKWTFGLFDCCSPFGTCCMATWCPCILYGKTYAREHGDPDSSGCNGSCCAFYCLMCIGGSCILQCINRTSTREKYGIEGSSFSDFCTSCWCACCQLIQEDKESIVRTTGMDPKTKQPYASPHQMTYP
ncbi:uncharacterized protein Z518_06769 [Rhinocladiella mackenziei CBS 650.93]|uniref:DUF614 domain protein n=1 Tax=Rhinocladiella mackenziei CBS 650.93 TaxID=1442369 RepID=A0A0D2FMI6_9EURO|nr:uncharacterized protein Z518_06769 [Rhinocladiella mackenziei CBS 650.93]KIX03217.1 hypothetical protein Z518_06769 [Rhinocladiella mackenziei CBS 650.93]